MRSALGTVANFTHVRSHTEGLDIPSRGNSFADRIADEAAVDPNSRPAVDSPFLLNEETVIFWEAKCADICDDSTPLHSRLWHISGNLRNHVKTRVLDNLLKSWQGHRKQARVNGPGLLRQLCAVRKSRDPDLLLYLLLASTQQLPTADRLVWPAPARLLCPRCTRRPQNALHTLCCPTVRNSVTRTRVAVIPILECLCAPTLVAPSTSHVHRSLAAEMHWRLCWYAPNRPSCNDFLGSTCPDPHLAGAPSDMNGYDRLTGSLGILPPGSPN
jgi:hypothetical protein